jgi:hypothetical protein
MSMTDVSHLLQKRLLLLLKRGAWPYYAAIIGVAVVIWLLTMP